MDKKLISIRFQKLGDIHVEKTSYRNQRVQIRFAAACLPRFGFSIGCVGLSDSSFQIIFEFQPVPFAEVSVVCGTGGGESDEVVLRKGFQRQPIGGCSVAEHRADGHLVHDAGNVVEFRIANRRIRRSVPFAAVKNVLQSYMMFEQQSSFSLDRTEQIAAEYLAHDLPKSVLRMHIEEALLERLDAWRRSEDENATVAIVDRFEAVNSFVHGSSAGAFVVHSHLNLSNS